MLCTAHYCVLVQVLLMGAGDEQSDSIVKQLHQIISQQLSRYTLLKYAQFAHSLTCIFTLMPLF